MADNVLEPYTFSFGDAKSAFIGCSLRVWVSPTSILQRKRSRCIYVCIACGCYEAPQRACQIWKSFCDQDRPFSSFTWCGRLFFCSENFRVCIRSKQGELVPTCNFLNLIFSKSDFKNTCWASPKPNIQHKIAPTAYLNRRWISNFLRKIRFGKIGVASFNIASNRNYYFRFWR